MKADIIVATAEVRSECRGMVTAAHCSLQKWDSITRKLSKQTLMSQIALGSRP